MKKYMRNSKVRFVICILTAALMVAYVNMAPVKAYVLDVEPKDAGTPVSTPEDLKAIKNDPAGNYYLANDIDMSGVEWEPFVFNGELNGCGYSVLNLTITKAGEDRADTYDGNYKVYDTCFAGMFSKIENASITDFNLVNVRADVEMEESCFVGSIAGYSSESTITNCTVSGELSLTVNAPMFGVGGIVGYGNGKISETTADTTLICIDTNVEERDEQFLGGICAAGYVNVDNCNVNIDGYVSDHGYVHNGGLIGMYIFYPKGQTYYGSITYNNVQGKITFFEDNTNRRAYCKAMIGEIMTYEFEYGGNAESFVSDERFEYDRNLLPETCDSPSYDAVVTEAVEGAFGYTTYTCNNCGYTYTDNYTIYQEPEEITTEPETETTKETEASESESTMVNQDNPDNMNIYKIVIIAVACAVLIIVIMVVLINRRNNKK